MTDQELPPAPPASERRRNAALRAMVDEMLAALRAATRRELWSPEERDQYERELAGIMTRVRAQAVHRDGAPTPQAGDGSSGAD